MTKIKITDPREIFSELFLIFCGKLLASQKDISSSNADPASCLCFTNPLVK